MSTKTDELATLHELLRPVNGHLTVTRDKPEEVTEAGIFLPENSRDIMTTGTVVRVSEDEETAELGISPGDRIYFSNYSTDELKIDGLEILMVSRRNVKGVVNSTKKVTKK